MRRIFIIIILVFDITCICFSQDRPPDSLLNEVNKHPQGDTVRLRLLIQLAEYYRYNNTDKGMAVTEEAIALAQKNNNLFYLGSAYYNREFYYYTSGDFETKSVASISEQHCF